MLRVGDLRGGIRTRSIARALAENPSLLTSTRTTRASAANAAAVRAVALERELAARALRVPVEYEIEDDDGGGGGGGWDDDIIDFPPIEPPEHPWSVTADMYIPSNNAPAGAIGMYRFDVDGNAWAYSATVTETVPHDAWTQSSIVPNEDYFSEREPRLPLNDPLIDAATDIRDTFLSLAFSPSCMIVFRDVVAVDAAAPMGVEDFLVGARNKAFVTSRYMALRRSDMAAAIDGCYDDVPLSRVDYTLGPRRCVPQWLIATYGPILASMRSRDNAQQQRRMVNVEAERALRRDIELLDGDDSSESRASAQEMQQALDAGVPKVEMTYDGLHRFWFFTEDDPHTYIPYVEGNNFMVTLKQLRRWFEVHKTKLVVLGADDKVLPCSYVPSNGRSLLPVGSVKVVDGHLYPLNVDLMRLHRVEGSLSAIEDASALFGVSKSVVPKLPTTAPDDLCDAHCSTDVPAPRLFVEDLHELLDLPLCDGSYNARGDVVWYTDVTGNFDLMRIYWELRVRGISAALRTCDHRVTGIVVRVFVEDRDALPACTDAAARADSGGDDDEPMPRSLEPLLYGADARGEPGEEETTRAPRGSKPPRAVAVPTSCELRLVQLPTPRGESVPVITTRKQYEVYTSHFNALRRACMATQSRSVYAPMLKRVLQHMGWVGMSYGVDATPPLPLDSHHGMYVAIDGNRMYTSCLHAVAERGFPVFNVFDDFEPCSPSLDDVPYDPLAFYMVRRRRACTTRATAISPLDVLLERDVCAIPGLTLKLCLEVPEFHECWDICSVCRPSKVVDAAPVMRALRALYEPMDDGIDERVQSYMRKDIVNKIVGMMGMMDTTRERSFAFDQLDEAMAYASSIEHASMPWALYPPRNAAPSSATPSFHARSMPASPAADAAASAAAGPVFQDEPPVWIVTLKSKAHMVDGFRAVWAHVVAECRRRVYLKTHVINALNREVVAVKTDCVWVRRVETDVEIPKQTSFAAIVDESWSQTFTNDVPVPLSTRAPWQQAAEERLEDAARHAMSPPLPPPLVHETVHDEMDTRELAALFEAGRMNIQADAPGCGKTQSWINWIKASGRRGLLVCPYNALCLAVNREQHEGVTACTAFDVLGLRLTDDGGCEAKTARDITDIDAILWDEMSLYETAMLQRIFAFEKRVQAERADDGREMHFHYTSDYHQLGPIEHTVHADDDYASMHYYSSILNRHCPRVLTLHVVKRVASDEDRAAVRALLDALWGTLEEQAAGVQVEWTPERRAAVLALPIFRRRVRRIQDVPPDARAVTYYRATAASMGRALHSRAPALAPGAASAVPPLPTLSPAATSAAVVRKRSQPSGAWKRRAKRLREQGLPVPPWVPPSDDNEHRDVTDILTQREPWADDGDGGGAAAAPTTAEASSDKPSVFEGYVLHQVVRCTKRFRCAAGVFHVNYEYEIVRLDDGANEARLKPLDAFAGDFEGVVSPTRLKHHFAYLGGQTAHSLQGASVDAPLMLCDLFTPLVSRRWITTAATRARDMSTLLVWIGPSSPHRVPRPPAAAPPSPAVAEPRMPVSNPRAPSSARVELIVVSSDEDGESQRSFT